MALTRKALKAMGLTEEQVDSIVEMHTETLNGLKNEAEQYKADAKKLKDVEKELNDLKQDGGEDWKSKYEAEKSAHSKTKSDYEAKETAEKVKEAYRAVLKEAGVADKYMGTALKATDFSGMKLGKDGKLEDIEALKESAKTEWADFIQTTTTKGADVANPPANSGKRLTREEIYKKDDKGRYVLSTAERQKALAENMAAGE